MMLAFFFLYYDNVHSENRITLKFVEELPFLLGIVVV